jgi:type I restriction enzyme S subunit
MNDTPKIRFNEFADKWGQRKLGEVADKVTEKNTQNLYSETFTNSAEFGVISQRDFFDHDISNANNIGGYYIVKAEDFVYNPRISVTAPCGPINCNRLGRNGVMSPLYTVFRTHDVDTVYLEWYFKSHCWHSYMYFNGNTGARSDRFSIKNDLFFRMPIPVPSVPEQRKIGNVLTDLDNLIVLHQRKYEQMMNVKKSMLEKLFPHNGASVPETRFKEFTGDWERRKLGDVFEEYCEKHREELPPLTIIQGKGTILRDEANRSLQYDKSVLHNYKMVKKGDFIVHLRSFEGGLEKANSDGIISPAYYAFHGEETDTRFYYPYFRSHEFINVELSRHVYGIRDGRSIDISGMKTIMIPYTSIEEQRKIGDFLEGLNTLIELYHQELLKLKQIKSACLDSMFI